MNWTSLYDMQEQLDNYITENHQLETSSLSEYKILALLVEIGELANETRCFKFWSTKSPSPKSTILEEYVDGLHFILSLGLDLNFRYKMADLSREMQPTAAFLNVYSSTDHFKRKLDEESYIQLFADYLTLGRTLGFDENEIQQAYCEKNEVNFQRQDQGY
ncbi:dUTP diphosphatase [Halobacillus salinarum]|uniref:dUTP diphosphatase n=1 Tax=Halobacillus salinarum TaxID=2932257 RepID=A0ABY4ENZ7_9BACI|nr:dUTP diphosphatase [Halobacillus salinarum]UOQ46192.1 dUTP diphosphatase [Halobacillus salinarum]